MGKKVLQFVLAAGLSLLLLWALAQPWGPAPALGPFFSPSEGFWANAAAVDSSSQTITLPQTQLEDSVSVYVDAHRIPHIFASSNRDLYFAQGYVTARDRLWQMELQTRAAAGRLSEVLGERTLNFDRYQRRIGMGYAAEQALKGMMADSTTMGVMKAYAAGINAYVSELSAADYPLEYKLLGHEPEQWTPLKTALLLKYMTYTLAGSNRDLQNSNTRAFFGEDFITNVLDTPVPLEQPTIPASKPWNIEAQAPSPPDSAFVPSVVKNVPPFRPDPTNGSNNWAVSARKTASGYPILANDPHLNMTLPSIWYVLQLHGPNVNTMGASLPGAPGITVGFNKQAAWGTTNVGADVWDWYEITFRDSSLAEYRYDGEWRPTRSRIEEIKVKGQPSIIDTVVYTHHGPVTEGLSEEPLRSNVPKLHAMRWIAFEESNELAFFYKLNRAQGYDDYRQALTHYKSPAQNWVFADTANIGITVTGQYPLKWPEQGRFISDGSDPAYDWQGWIPFEQIPTVKNPPRGFVSSANQRPTDNSYPYYLDDEFAPFERGRRINDRLAALNDITPADMQHLQMDTYSYHAQTVLPLMLQKVNIAANSNAQKNAYNALQQWDLQNKGTSVAPSLFHYWWDALEAAIWNDEYAQIDRPLTRPSRDQTVALIRQDSLLQWIDNINTPEKETLADLVNQSFKNALKQLQDEFGPYGDDWKWGYVNNTTIEHVGQIPGLGRRNLFTDGAGESVNAVRGSHGPSWRMVVEVGPKIKAWGVYPGGQSGHPGSPYYDNMIDDWVEGNLYRLWFMNRPPANTDSLAYSITLK